MNKTKFSLILLVLLLVLCSISVNASNVIYSAPFGTGNYAQGMNYDSAQQSFAYIINITTPLTIDNITLYLKRAGNPSGNIDTYIFNNSISNFPDTLLYTSSTSLLGANVSNTAVTPYNFTFGVTLPIGIYQIVTNASWTTSSSNLVYIYEGNSSTKDVNQKSTTTWSVLNQNYRLGTIIWGNNSYPTLTNNLKNYYKMDELTNNVSDSSMGNNKLVMYGTINSDSGKILTSRGNYTNSNYFDGSYGYFSDLTSFTISTWIKPNTAFINMSTHQQRFLSYDNSGAGTCDMAFAYYENTGSFLFNVNNAGLPMINSSYNLRPSVNTWYFLTGTYNATSKNMTIYVNGVAGTPYTYNQASCSFASNYLRVGWKYNIANSLNISLDEIGVWDRALSSSEITQLYNSGNGLSYPFTTFDGNITQYTLVNRYNSSSINIFNITISGTTYSTTNGTVLINSSGFPASCDITAQSPTYLTQTIYNNDCHTNLQINTSQAEVRFQAKRKVDNITIPTNITIGATTQLNGTIFYLNANTYTINTSSTGYLNKSESVVVTARQNNTVNITNMTNANITFTLNNLYNNTNLTDFNVTIANTTYSFSETDNTLTSTSTFQLVNGTYTYTVTKTGYFGRTGTITLNAGANNIQINTSQAEVKFRASEFITNSLINANFTINGTKKANDTVFYLDIGTYNITVQSNGYYNKSQNVTITSLQNNTVTLTNITNSNVTFLFNSYANGSTFRLSSPTYLYYQDYLINGTTLNLNTTNISYTASIINNFVVMVSYPITITNGSSTVNLSSYGMNYIYFQDAKNTSNKLQNANITMKYPNGNILSLLTDTGGRINFSSANNVAIQNGTYNVTLEATNGYVTPITFNQTFNLSQLPFNITRNVSRANLTINTINAETGLAITGVNVTVSISNVGLYITNNGTIFIENQTMMGGTYTAFASSPTLYPAQVSFTYTNQEVLNLTIQMINTSSTNFGNYIVKVLDGYYDNIAGATISLQKYSVSTDSWEEVSRCTSDSNGQCIFGILLNQFSYRAYATKLINGVTYSAYNSMGGGLVTTNPTTVNIFLIETVTPVVDELTGLIVTPYNTTLVGNNSYLNADFNDPTGNTHTICIEYSYNVGFVNTKYPTGLNCVTSASGNINNGAVYGLNGTVNNQARIYVVLADGTERTLFIYRYSGSNSFENTFSDLIAILMLFTLIILLGISMHVRNLMYFFIGVIGWCILYLVLTPSWLSMGLSVSMIVLAVVGIYMARKKEAVYSV